MMTTPTSQPNILICLAHPDDESFGSGGTLAYYAGLGAQVMLVCATRGEAGEISDPALATPETLPMVREAELRCACQALKINEPIFLGYRDSGMAGTPENDNPQAFTNTPATEVVPRLVGIIRRLRPGVVITFEPGGGYGHPDHIAIHQHTIAAVHAAAQIGVYPEQGPAWQISRLLYAVLPRSLFQKMHDEMVAVGIDTSRYERLSSGEAGWPDDQIDITIDVSTMVEAKWAALHCHRTQFGQDSLFRQLPEDVMKAMMSQEYFAQAWPEHEDQLHLSGLFDKLPNKTS